MFCAFIAQYLSVYDVINFNYSSSRNHVVYSIYALEKIFELVCGKRKANRRGAKGKSALQRQLSSVCYCVLVLEWLPALVSLSRGQRLTHAPSSPLTLSLMFLFMILTFRSETPPKQKQPHTGPHIHSRACLRPAMAPTARVDFSNMRVSLVGLES